MNSMISRRRAGARAGSVDRREFHPRVFEGLVKDMQSGVLPLSKVTLSDKVVKGLRVIIRSSGTITYHVHYDVDGSRPFIKVGHHPDMSVDQARRVARTIISLAAKGIDPQLGLHDRLIRELIEKGEAWRP